MKIARFGFSLFGINTYVVWDQVTKDCAIIDPGMIGEREEQSLVNFIEKNDLKVTHLINTHLHIDHAIGDSFVAEKFGVPIEAHPSDAVLGERLQQQALEFGIAEKVKDVTITSPLSDGEIIKIGNGELKVMHVPGHSPGGVVLYDEADKILIAGDVLFQGSIGRADLPGGNMDQLISGIKSKLLPLPDDVIVLPGHGPQTTIGSERHTNPFLR